MNFVTVKKPSEVSLKGIRIRFMEEDKGLVGIEFKDVDGNVAVVKVASSYGSNVKIMIPAPPAKDTVYRVKGHLSNNVEVREQYADKDEAQQRLRELKSSDYAAELALETAEVLAVDETTTPAIADDTIPF